MKTAKLFRNGQSQAVRLPLEFRFQGNSVFIKKMGNAIVLLPAQQPWQSLFARLNKFSVDFMETRVQPAQQDRKNLF